MEDPDVGMLAVSLVEHPAIGIPFICLSEEKQMFKMDEERRIISGPAILADTPIYRNSPMRGEYHIVFEKDTIRQLVEKYSRDGLFNSVNLQHDQHTFVNSAVMIESLIIDKERGVCPNEFSDIPDGSWIVSYRITDDNLWNEIKTSGVLNGFSIEILSEIELVEMKSNKRNTNMNLFNFAKLILKLGEVTTDKGVLIVDGDIEIGKPVFVEVEGEPVPAENGEYTLEDGKVIVVTDGIVTEIKGNEVVEEPKEEETLEGTPEETPEEPQEDEKDLRIKELEKELEEKTAKIAELEAEIATLKGTVAEQEEKLKMSVETPITKKNKVITRENKALKYFE